MKRMLLLAVLGCAACADDPTPEQQEALDRQAVELVEQANAVEPPMVEIVPETIMPADIDLYDIKGASCTYAPGTSLGARVISRAADAFMKIDDDIVRFAADPGSRELGMGTRSLYNGREYSLVLELAGEGEAAGDELSEYEGTVTLRDRWDRVVYTGSGTARCGA